jgi:hypothetical protein
MAQSNFIITADSDVVDFSENGPILEESERRAQIPRY